MRFKLTLFLLLANLVTFGLIWKLQHDLSLPPVNDAPIFPAGIRKIAVSGAGVAGTWAVEKKQHVWQLTEPFSWDADSAAVETIVNQLNFTKLDGSFSLSEAIENGNKAESYGLDNPKLVVTVSGGTGAAPVIVKIGQSPSGSVVYLQTPNDQIVRVPNELLDCLMIPANELRKQTVFTLRDFEVNKISVRTAGLGSDGLVSLARKQKEIPGHIDFEQVWRFETPIDAAAASDLVSARLAQLAKIRYEKFITGARADQAAYGLSAPAMRITLGAGGAEGSQTLLVGRRDPDSPTPAYFAKIEDNNTAVFTVPAAEIDEWRNAGQSLRESNFVSFYPAQLERIVIHENDKSLVLLRRFENKDDKNAAGAESLAPQAENDLSANDLIGDWNIPALPNSNTTVTLAADPVEMKKLIATLRNFSATDMALPEGETLPPEKQKLYAAFTADAPTPEELREWRFDEPVRSVEMRFRDGTRRTLIIAPPVDAKSPHHARLSDHPSVYAVPDITEKLSVDPDFYRLRLIEQLPETAQITGIKITDLRTKKTLVDEQRSTQGALLSWQDALADETPAEQARFLALLKELRAISAKRFRSEKFSPEYTVHYLGASVPEGWRYRLDVALRPAAGDATETRTWFFTKRLGGTTQIAGSAQYNCVFEIRQSLLDALFPLTFGRDVSADVPEVKPPADLPAVPK